jgi:peptidylprolyl isomerase domain and WD repeat-containing protein 1
MRDSHLLSPSIQVINIETNKLARILGQVESGERFVALSLYQGTPTQDHQLQHAVKGTDSTAKGDKGSAATLNGVDPTVVCASYKKHRFFLFTGREPDDEDGGGGVSRDVINEKPMKADVALEAERALQHDLGRRAVIHTTLGDIEMKLFADECPKTVENFTKLSQKGSVQVRLLFAVTVGVHARWLSIRLAGPLALFA